MELMVCVATLLGAFGAGAAWAVRPAPRFPSRLGRLGRKNSHAAGIVDARR